MGSTLRAFRRLALYGLLTAFAWPLQVLLLVSRRLASALPPIYHRLCCAILGIELHVAGAPESSAPMLFVANHSSYLDITVLGALVRGCFVAKVEVQTWPIYGFLARLQRTVFIERRRRRVGAGRDVMAERLAGGDSLILFPEGTTSDGIRVLPFKSSFFAAAEGACVQPVSIAYVRLDGVPIGRHLRPFIAWYGAMTLIPHVWRMAGLGRIEVEIRFHAPVRLADFVSRKALAAYCQAVVTDGVASALAGRRATRRTGAEDEALLGLVGVGRMSI
jgi:1-acyl-sn-glycerol-3-phosphate acyltransferase